MLVTISNRWGVNVEAVRGTESISWQGFQRVERMIQECIVGSINREAIEKLLRSVPTIMAQIHWQLNLEGRRRVLGER